MKRDWLIVIALWLAMTALGLVAVWDAPFFPPAGAHEATVSDNAFRQLTLMAVPVFAFVMAMLVTSVLRFRVRGAPDGDGPPIRGSRSVYVAWIATTSLLAIALIVSPGLAGLAEMLHRDGEKADVTVKVVGSKWSWAASYPNLGVLGVAELVLPAHRRVRIDVTSAEAPGQQAVLHSLWIPAFRVKIDAVPGRVTTVYVTPDREGSFQADPGLRIQCAEMCGLGHASMRMPVRVVSPEEFESWVSQQAARTAKKEEAGTR